jgi:hypothetical protein
MIQMNERNEEKAIWGVMARRGLMNIARARENSAIMVNLFVGKLHDADIVLSFLQ